MSRIRRTKSQVEEEKQARMKWFDGLTSEEKNTIWEQYYNLYNKKIVPFVRKYFKSYYYKIDTITDEALIIGFNQYLRFLYGKEKGLKQYEGYTWPMLEKIILNNVKHEIILNLQKESSVISIEELEEEQESEFIIEERLSIRRKLWKYLKKIYNDLKEADEEAAEFFAKIYMGKLIFRNKDAFKRYLKENQRQVTLLKFWLNQLYGVELKTLY